MMNKRIKDFFRMSSGYLVVGFITAIYVSTAFLRLDETGKTVNQIIADGALVFFLGYFIDRVFTLQGMMNGEMDLRFQNTFSLHGDTVLKISPYIDKLDEWCRLKNEENLKMQRTRILASEGMRYSDYFNDDGSAKNVCVDTVKMKNRHLRRVERKRVKCFVKALHIKLTPITAGELTSEGDRIGDPYNFGRSKKQYERQMSISDIISKVCIAFIFGYYGVRLIENFSFVNLIWTAMQAAMFLLVGVSRMYNSYFFITGEFRGRIVKKINFLEMFWSYISKDAEKAEADPAEIKDIAEIKAEV